MNRQEAINIVKKNWPDSSFTSLKEALVFLIPELMNTDDEKIKEAIIKGITHAAEEGCFCADNYSVKECIAWLEKQKVLSIEEDMRGKENVLWCIKQAKKYAKDENEMGTCWFAEKWLKRQGEKGAKGNDGGIPFSEQEPYEGLTDFERTLADICIGWIGQELGWKQYIKDNADVLLKIAIKKFNSIQDAPFEQKPAEWSEEDEMFVHGLVRGLSAKRDIHGHTTFSSDCIDITETINWLKSLRQKQWKPSDEHYELEEFAKIVRGNLTGISKAVQELFEAKYLQLTGNKMYGGYKD